METRKIRLSDITTAQFLDIVKIERHCGLEPFTMEMIISSIEVFDTYAVFDGESIVAFITVELDGGYSNGGVYILNLNVKKEYRRRGIAESLIRMVASLRDEDSFMTLDVSPSNEKAMNLYEKLGFIETDIHSINGNGDLVMYARLGDLIDHQ